MTYTVEARISEGKRLNGLIGKIVYVDAVAAINAPVPAKTPCRVALTLVTVQGAPTYPGGNPGGDPVAQTSAGVVWGGKWQDNPRFAASHQPVGGFAETIPGHVGMFRRGSPRAFVAIASEIHEGSDDLPVLELKNALLSSR